MCVHTCCVCFFSEYLCYTWTPSVVFLIHSTVMWDLKSWMGAGILLFTSILTMIFISPHLLYLFIGLTVRGFFLGFSFSYPFIILSPKEHNSLELPLDEIIYLLNMRRSLVPNLSPHKSINICLYKQAETLSMCYKKEGAKHFKSNQLWSVKITDIEDVRYYFPFL